MSADLLRRAAAKLREHAEAAQNKRPWCPDYTWTAVRHVQRNCDFLECGTHGEDPNSECWSFDMYDGRYVALMHPPVALALADVLDRLAITVEECAMADGKVFEENLTESEEAGFALARAILREQS